MSNQDYYYDAEYDDKRYEEMVDRKLFEELEEIEKRKESED